MKKTVPACMIAMILISSTALSAPPPLPDLAVTDIKVDNSHVKKDGKVDVIYTVKNQGKAAAKASKTRVEALTTGNMPVIQQNVPSIDPGNIYANRVTYSVSAGKKYLFKATADYNNTVRESNENNNSNSISFSVGRSF
ncbi:MAG: hypothetical protein NTZ10_01115 [Candidatus Saganbacteria bacterium]|nr:hypothetical protein [Candidatus Saganbacteria bacterium]